MRYYDIRMTNPDGELIKEFGFAKFGYDTSYTSYINGRTITGALNVEFNIPQGPYATPQQGSWLRVWGIGIDELANTKVLGPPVGSKDIRFCGITIKAGMQKGLPLAKPAQAGLILDGSIFRPFGNWQMTDQTLEMNLLPAVGVNNGQIIAITFDYQTGKSMADAIKEALTNALPKYTIKVEISSDLVVPYPAPGIYNNLNQFAAMILKMSLQSQFQGIKPLAGGKYGGVQFRIVGKEITAYDGTKDYGGTTASNPKQIAFEDIIGQPTWIGTSSINFKCVLRADINVGDFISLPNTLAVPYVLSTPNAAIPGTPSRNSLAYKGPFVITNVRHYGNFRAPQADNWCTVYNASYLDNSGALIASSTNANQ